MDAVSAASAAAISTTTPDLSMTVSVLNSIQNQEQTDVSIMLSSIGIGQNFSGAG
jgi:hypothetical protein